MQRRALAAVLTLTLPLLSMLATQAPSAADESGREWTAEPAMISNHGVYRDGEFVYQDYIYDDHGANTDRVSHTDAPLGAAVRPGDPTNPRTGSSGGQIRHTGDFMYRAQSAYFLNAADLIEFRAADDGDAVNYLFRLGAMTDDTDVVIGMCVEEDGSRATGVREWPLGAGLSEALGCDHHYTITADGGVVTSGDGSSADLAELGGAVVADVEENTLNVRVPTTVADPGDRTWRYYVGAGLWDADAGTWLQVPALPSNPGSPTETGGGIGVPQIWDLLSNNHEPNSYWRDERQADDLAAGKIDKHFIDVSFSRLAQDIDDPEPQLTGVVDRIYVSDHPMEPTEGILFQTIALGPRNYVYYGAYQPYAVVIPSTYYEQLAADPDKEFPFDQCLHPLNGNHHVEIYYAQVEAQRNYVAGVTGTTEHTGYQGFSEYENIIDRQNQVYACSVGRGEGVGHAGGNGMVDAIEVAAEVERIYSIDENRRAIHGISLGAIGSWYMSTLYPDRYSTVLPSIFTGSTGDLTNLYNLPTFFTIGKFDQFAQGLTSGDNVANSMENLGNEYLYYHHLARFHELSLGHEAFPFSEPLFYTRERVENPARVKYLFSASRASAKIPHDGSVYWVNGMVQRGTAKANVDVTSLGRADELPTEQVIFDGLYENTHEGYQARMRGLFRVSEEEFATMWTPEQFQEGWRELDLEVTHTELEVPTVSNGFDLSALGFSALSLDLGRMEVDPSAPITATVTTDGPTALGLQGAFGEATTVTVNGADVPFTIVDGTLVIELADTLEGAVLQVG